MGAAFFSGGTKHIRDVLQDAFGPLNVQANAASYGSLFNPTGGITLAQIADTNYMDLPATSDKYWPTLHARFKTFLTTLYNADPTTHASILQAMYGALTAKTVMPMKFHVAHQATGYSFVSWAEEDDSGITWLNCLLFCPVMTGPLAQRLRRVVKRKQSRGTGRKGAIRKHSKSAKKSAD
jgi:hypothetical protein